MFIKKDLLCLPSTPSVLHNFSFLSRSILYNHKFTINMYGSLSTNKLIYVRNI